MPVDIESYLLASDLHLTDSPSEEYRWKIFDVLAEHAIKHHVNDIFLLGDVWDRKDRHSAKLVQDSIFALMRLQETTDAKVWIIAGNHDQPISGPYFWYILSYIKTEDTLGSYLSYVTKPDLYHNIMLLPFAKDPKQEWKNIPWFGNAVFMHQTGQGATVEGGRELTSNNLPTFPPDVAVFSGDVHRPQTVNGITYVGAPYPIKFSETWDNRIILIKENDFKNFISIPVNIMKRAIIDISSLDELKNIKLGRDNQIRVRYKLSGTSLTQWPVIEKTIRDFCKTKGINLVSLEASFEGGGLKEETQKINFMSPEELIKMFCKEENLSDKILEVGLDLVRNSK